MVSDGHMIGLSFEGLQVVLRILAGLHILEQLVALTLVLLLAPLAEILLFEELPRNVESFKHFGG